MFFLQLVSILFLFFQGSWVKPGSVVIDCGINSIPDASRANGKQSVQKIETKHSILKGRSGKVKTVIIVHDRSKLVRICFQVCSENRN
jgi:5,10-methylene-tetrahydrofolate dehydrogenase/methenyl tetrahydrofolate cyclohydrolase